MKKLQEYANMVLENKNNPSQLSEIHIEISAKFAYLAEEMKDLEIRKAEFSQIKFAGDKPLSDTSVDLKWKITDKGKEGLRLKWEMRGLEKLMSAIKSNAVITALEARNAV